MAEEDENIATKIIYIISQHLHNNTRKFNKEYGAKQRHHDEASLPQKKAKASLEITLFNRGLPTMTGCPFKVNLYSATSTKNKKEIIPTPSPSMKPGAN